MAKLSLQILLSIFAAALATAQNNSSPNQFTQIVFHTISGPVRDALIYAPTPSVRCDIVPQPTKPLRGIYKADLDNGMPYDVRVVQSTGYKCLDEAALATIRNWRFRAHRLVWATVPMEFRPGTTSKKR